MSKKDFEAMAAALRVIKPDDKSGCNAAMEQWKHCINVIANVCAASNERFDHWKFISACYGE